MTEPAETVDDVLSELGSFINQELAATTMALGGLRTLAYQVFTVLEAKPDAAETHLVGVGVPDVGWVLRFDDSDAARAYIEDLAPAGPMVQRLTQQLIVTIDTAWEEEFRGRLARIHGVARDAVAADYFGDIRRLRNDIVHHRGIASPKGATRCSVLPHRFAQGDAIYLDDRDLLNLRLQVPFATLVRPPQAASDT